MAIINSYPNITPKAEDLLLISDTSVEGNPTKTASVNSVLALIPSGSGGGGIANITSSNSNFLSVTNPDGPLVVLNIQTGFVASGGNTLATTGDIYNFTTTSITNAINALPTGVTSFACDISDIPAFVSNVTTSASGAVNLTISRTGGSNNTFLDYTGNWSEPSVQGMTSWEITADTGGADKVEQGYKVNFVGKEKITTEFVTQGSSEYDILITHDLQTQTNTTPSTTLTNGGTFTAISANVGVDGTGHVTGQTLTTYTLPTNAINSIGVDAPIENTGTASDPVIDIQEADSTTDGYLSSTKFAEFDAKQTEISLSVSGTSGAATFNAATGALNIPIYSGGGGGGVSGVGLSASAFNAFSVTTLGGGPNPITGSDTFVLGINGPTSASEYLDGSGNWSTPTGTANLSNIIGTNNVQIICSSGTNTDVPAATTTTAGAMIATDKLRLNQLIITTSSETALGPSPINTSSNTLTLPWQGTSSDVVLGDGSLTTLPTQFSWTLDGMTGTPQVIADNAVVEIIGTGSVSTAISGNTLTISSTASGSGTVESIGVTNGNFTTGSTSTGADITTSGNISFDLSADGNSNTTSFLRGDNKWSTLTNGDGVAALTNSSTDPTYETTVALEYTGNRNIITAANSATLGDVELTDTVIFNDISQSNKVYKTTLQDVREIVAPVSNIPTYFATELNSSGSAVFANEGNISNNTQGLGGTVSSWTLTKATDNTLEVRFGTAIGSSTYMVNFSIEELTPNPLSKPAYPLATIQNKTKNGFDVQYNKIGDFLYDATDLSQPVLTNFIIFV